MGPEELVRVAAVAPGARLIASHMDAVNHARLDRAVLRAFVESRGLQNRFLIPEDGEILIFFLRRRIAYFCRWDWEEGILRTRSCRQVVEISQENDFQHSRLR